MDFPIPLLQSILNSGESYISVKDEEGHFVYINDLDASLYNATPDKIVGKTAEPFVGRKVFLQWLEDDNTIIKEGRPKHLHPYSRVDISGNTHWFETVKTPIFDKESSRNLLVVIHRDITVIKKSEIERHLEQERASNSEKNKLVRSLSANFAHDFNNILAIILNSAKAVCEYPGIDSPLRQSSQTILETCERASELVSRLLMLSGENTDDFQSFDLNQCLLDKKADWSRDLGTDSELIFNLTGQSTMIHGSAAQIGQGLWQLILNAHEALHGKGRITVITERSIGSNSTPCVRLTVLDEGSGMDQSTKGKMFNPLFSTKPIGQGSGLGLALVEKVVKNHQGKITVESSLRKGTSISIELPTNKESSPGTIPQSPKSPKSTALSGKTILLAEDEPLLREIFTRFLKGLGCVVISASSGDDAWNWMNDNSFRFDCLVTDIVMPGLINGVDLSRKLSEQNPTIPSILISGHSFDFLSKGISLPENTKFLSKPFAREKLYESLSEFFTD